MDENYKSLAILEKEMFMSAVTDWVWYSRHRVICRKAW